MKNRVLQYSDLPLEPYAIANALSISPGEYVRKNETQSNWRGPYKRWSMWFNWCKAKNLTRFDMPQILLKEWGAFGNEDIGGAWLSSPRAVKYWIKSCNERNHRV